MSFDFSLMTELDGHQSTIYSWTLGIDPKIGLILAAGAAIALILGVVIAVRR